jgi:hypothetical protein
MPLLCNQLPCTSRALRNSAPVLEHCSQSRIIRYIESSIASWPPTLSMAILSGHVIVSHKHWQLRTSLIRCAGFADLHMRPTWSHSDTVENIHIYGLEASYCLDVRGYCHQRRQVLTCTSTPKRPFPHLSLPTIASPHRENDSTGAPRF